jgi:hypothetical protein
MHDASTFLAVCTNHTMMMVNTSALMTKPTDATGPSKRITIAEAHMHECERTSHVRYSCSVRVYASTVESGEAALDACMSAPPHAPSIAHSLIAPVDGVEDPPEYE